MLCNSEKIHLKIYNEIVNRNLNPKLSKFDNPEHAAKMVFEFNTHKIPGRKCKIDFRSFGFASLDDFHLQDVQDGTTNNPSCNIVPNRIYELKDKMDVPEPPGLKSCYFLELMCDEFERIKIKAQNFLLKKQNDRKIALYANKNILFAKQLAYDSWTAFKDMNGGFFHLLEQENSYIFFTVNLFLIRVIVYYQNLFKPFIDTPLKSEKQLRAELYNNTVFKGTFPFSPYQEPIRVLIKAFIEKSEMEHYPSAEKSDSLQTGFEEINSGTDNQQEKSPDIIQWNVPVNVITTLFNDLMNHKLTNGKTLIEGDTKAIVNIICDHFHDKTGKELSRSTIETCLRPNRHDKRAKGDKKIDISGYIYPKTKSPGNE